ncbi:uncharacterized protein N7518_003347 [Penicillium psychrosexuale]|uniref:uncharacterized protein n=1 Tax=Penicillium psychrosexuale TaxID=1002107 RepID=UPI00254506F0|nr:uncharacterized protein N7518_003347 [Penicillium psychrosexuale]KAJ5801279.1 hypothetical protein N7518_003347 [Penicillium psychrosexuale]
MKELTVPILLLLNIFCKFKTDSLILIWTLHALSDNARELVVTPIVLVELPKELVMTIDNNSTNTKANTSTRKGMSQSSITITPACYLCQDPRHLQRRCPLFALWKSAVETLCRDRTIDPMSLIEQIDIGILVTALASALPDRDGDISMQ